VKTVSIIDPEMAKVAKIIIEKSLAVKPGEEFLVLTDTSYEREMAEALFAAAHSAGAVAQMLVLPPWPYRKSPPKATEMAIKSVKALVYFPTIHYTPEVKDLFYKKIARIVCCLFATKDMLIRAFSADLDKLGEDAKKLADIIRRGETLKITSKQGSDLSVPIKGKSVHYDDGTATEDHGRGWYTQLPSVVSFCNPPWVAEGTLVVDGSNQILGLVKEPIELTIEKGRITDIQGGREAEDLAAFIKSFDDPNSYHCPAHVCVGLNPNFKMSGNLMEDENARGVVCIGVGVNKYLPGGEVDAKMHTDVTLRKATLTVDGIKVLEGGELVI